MEARKPEELPPSTVTNMSAAAAATTVAIYVRLSAFVWPPVWLSSRRHYRLITIGGGGGGEFAFLPTV